MATQRDKQDRGRSAERPRAIPARGWRDIAMRVKREVKEDDLSIVAGGVAFYAFLSVFPALAALISIYGLVANPADVGTQLAALSGALPQGVHDILQSELAQLAVRPAGALSAGVVLSIVVALWTANKGTQALLTGLNIAYDQPDTRGFLKRNAISLLITLGAMLAVSIAIGAVVAVPALLGILGLSRAGELMVRWLRWPVLAGLVLLALAVLYRYGPSRVPARWRWVTPGSLIATILWLAGSTLFSWYVSHFGNYDKVYGSIAAIVIFLVWLSVSAYVLILGAELNAELERQTARDSTTEPPRPLGERGAHAADTIGETP